MKEVQNMERDGGIKIWIFNGFLYSSVVVFQPLAENDPNVALNANGMQLASNCIHPLYQRGSDFSCDVVVGAICN